RSQVAGRSHPHGGGEGGAAVTGLPDVVLALLPFGKSGQALILPQRGKSLPAAGENLVRIRLMPHIPKNFVTRAVEEIVKRKGELHHSQVGRKVTARHRETFDQETANLL